MRNSKNKILIRTRPTAEGIENIVLNCSGHLTIMNGPGDISTSGGKRGDMLRGILKIRRKRNTTSSRGLRLISDELSLCFVRVSFC